VEVAEVDHQLLVQAESVVVVQEANQQVQLLLGQLILVAAVAEQFQTQLEQVGLV